MIFVSGGSFRQEPAWKILATVVGDAVAGWQDIPGRTHTEVIAAFDRALEQT